MAWLFQDPLQALNPQLRIGTQLRQILRAHGQRDDVDARVVEMLKRVGLPDAERQARAWPHELSGGMRQRAMLASALIAQPDLLIADEPTTALDVTVQAQILELLEQVRDDTALLLITHDLGIVAGHCEHVVVLENGRSVEVGQTASVFASPRSEHTKALFDAAPRIDKDSVRSAVAGKALLAVEDAEICYSAEQRTLRAVAGVDLTIRAGETLAVVGESGSGKSSLMRGVLGLVPMQSGTVVYAGAALQGDVRTRSLSIRRDLQLVFQDPVSALNPQMRVAEIVGEPLDVHEPQLTAEDRASAVAAVLHKVGLGQDFLGRFPHQFVGRSGAARRNCQRADSRAEGFDLR